LAWGVLPPAPLERSPVSYLHPVWNPSGCLVSPWARRHFVSHQVYDHTSILKLVETKWNLPALTYRDANAAPMLDMLDLRRPSFAEPPRLAPPLAVADPSALTCSVTGPGAIPPPGSVTG
jgi:phospholipase C